MGAVPSAQWLKGLLRFKLVRYGIVGGVGGVINLLLFAALVNIGVWYLWASPISSWTTCGLNFLAHKLWTFGDKTLYTATWQLLAHLFLKFVWNALVITPLLLYWLVEYWGWNVYVSQVATGLAIGFLQNFLLYKYIIFTPRLGEWLAARKKSPTPAL